MPNVLNITPVVTSLW